MQLPSKRSLDVLGIGASTQDRLYLVDSFPIGDSVQVPQDHCQMGGGPTSTAICTIAALGGKTALIDRLGLYPNAASLLQDFEQYQVDTRHITLVEDETTGHSSILVRSSDGARAITHVPGTVAELQEGEVSLDLVDQATILHMNGRHLGAARQMISRAKTVQTLVSFDGGAGRFREELIPIYEQADILIVAHSFGQAATQQSEPLAILSSFAKHGAQVLAVTDGKRGSWILDSQTGESFHQPAIPPRCTVDTTGCGDTYHGGFLYALATGQSLKEAAQLAAKVASLTCEGLGGRSALSQLSASLSEWKA